MLFKKNLTLKSLHVRFVVFGLLCFILLITILILQERKNTIDSWKMQTILKSANQTSSYITKIMNGVILQDEKELESLLVKIKKAEQLNGIQIVSRNELSEQVISTCKTDYAEKYFFQIPVCYESIDHKLSVYHELRSVGYRVGYLKKSFSYPQFLQTIRFDSVLPAILVLLCFIFLSAFYYSLQRKYFLNSIKRIMCHLENKNVTEINQDIDLVELQHLAESLRDYIVQESEHITVKQQFKFNAKIRQIANQVAHDIKSPLSVLKSLSQSMSLTKEEDRLMLQMVIQNVSDIMQDLSEKSDSQVKSAQYNREIVQNKFLSVLVDRVISEKRIEYAHCDVKIDVVYADSVKDALIHVQPTVFKRVLSNLINNSVEALCDQGCITVELSMNGKFVSLSVKDNGKGIPKENIDLIFEQGQSFGKSHLGNSGLGLFHAKKSIESWGGKITVQSELNVGTEFILMLPLVIKEASDQIDYVLLDDNYLVRMNWESKAAAVGKRIFTFENTYELFDHLKWCGPNTKFYLDQNLKDGNLGVSVAQQLKSKGYEEVYIASAFDADDLKLPEGLVKGCVGKIPPFINNEN